MSLKPSIKDSLNKLKYQEGSGVTGVRSFLIRFRPICALRTMGFLWGGVGWVTGWVGGNNAHFATNHHHHHHHNLLFSMMFRFNTPKQLSTDRSRLADARNKNKLVKRGRLHYSHSEG